MYHKSVGQNCVMELDFAIDRTGNIDPTHAARYQEFGDWIRACYGTSVAATSGFVNATQFELEIPGGTIDRVAVREDLRGGQRVLGYTVEVLTSQSGWLPFANGTSVGNKHISIVTPVKGASHLRLTVTSSVAPSSLSLAAFAPCSSG